MRLGQTLGVKGFKLSPQGRSEDTNSYSGGKSIQMLENNRNAIINFQQASVCNIETKTQHAKSKQDKNK